VDELRKLGIDWPMNSLIHEHAVLENGQINLQSTVDKLKSKKAYYDGQLREAFNFKMKHGADYSEFTDQYDEYARMSRQLEESISYLEEIMARLEATNPR
jgi:chromosome segregation ATPase